MSEQLLPCPLCAGASSLDGSKRRYEIGCTVCGLVLLGEETEDKASLAARWNRRATPPAASAGEVVLAKIAAERRRQMEAEGWTPEHDDQHTGGEMAKAAACYAATGAFPPHRPPAAVRDIVTLTWPWAREWWKPRGGEADLLRAAALIVAELERLHRAAGATREGGA